MVDWGITLGAFGVAIGLPALVMAVPPFIQMVFGRPDLEVGYENFTGSDAKQLMVTLKNKTISGKHLRQIKVERETGDVMAHFHIRDAGTHKFVASDVSGYLHSAATREFGLVLRAMPGHSLGFPVVQFQNGRATVMDARKLMDERPLIVLPAGDYLAEAYILRGQDIYQAIRRFKVGEAAHETNWI